MHFPKAEGVEFFPQPLELVPFPKAVRAKVFPQPTDLRSFKIEHFPIRFTPGVSPR